ncbi:uncharacterized protein MYCFIDRAFT_151027 [Pseudocercospora fijiensis CIRAD86]|uniref:Uncharacterized protein n=1 Tax=Pseudocercospora fijiensis (strain CIRAD86) TaxID=383855 RepID=M3AN43_PSEFD|nr:uncharacterized protein MYCFIDRAFT_151027 [Pseudocercospora fijiensis CIRAD86]EME86021.1 hypothetical protein MYCFIDRAFT_151027 [Pseudocercospora fijiensis CIRAD86]
MLGEQEHQSRPPKTGGGGEAKAATLDAIRRRLRVPQRSRAQSCHTVDGLTADRDAVAWYWRLVAIGSSFMILGGFLMLPVTFEKQAKKDLRIGQAVVGIFAVALLTAGFSFTGLVCFAVRNPLFQAETVFLPSLTSCALGLLTIFYNFLVFNRYEWNTPALLVTIAAALTTIVYGGLLLRAQRKVNSVKAKRPTLPVPMTRIQQDSESSLWHGQGTAYYQNYNRNMFPSAYTSTHVQPAQTAQQSTYDSDSITEEEMQRQQMLMLLLQNDHDISTPDPTASTFRIDWQGREEEEAPAQGYYAPSSASVTPITAYAPQGIGRQCSNDLQPWDGVWREVRRPTN